jgi:3-oxoacyl-[acyl-carrier protein] reductase
MKTILITGASRGIGYDTALQLCRIKHRVIAVARNSAGLEKLYNEVRKAGYAENLIVIPADISTRVGVVDLVNRIKEVTPVIDVLVNNAGTLVNKAFAAITEEELRGVYEVNVFTPFRLIQACLSLLRKSNAPHIVNIGSMGGLNGSSKFPGLSAYSSSKGALAILSEVLAEELKAENIKVNCLALGAAQTEMLQEAFPGYNAPLSSSKMAEYISWFCIHGSEFFNGKVIPVALSTP